MRVPQITLEEMVGVIALAQGRTLEAAAEMVGISGSGVSKRVRGANRALNTRLFIKTEEGMSLTEEGETFYPDALRVIEAAVLAEARTKALLELKSGRLLVGHSTHLPPRLLAMIHRLEVDEPRGIKVIHRGGITASMKQDVVEGTTHVAFGTLPVAHPDLIVRQVLEEPVVVCLPSAHPLASRAVIRPQDLESETIIAVSRDSSPALHEEIDGFFKSFGVELQVKLDAFGPPEALAMVEQRLGICLVGASAPAGRRGVVVKQLSPQWLTRKSGIFFRQDNTHPVVKRFVEIVLQRTAKQRP